jgi:hypothetical protein
MKYQVMVDVVCLTIKHCQMHMQHRATKVVEVVEAYHQAIALIMLVFELYESKFFCIFL